MKQFLIKNMKKKVLKESVFRILFSTSKRNCKTVRSLIKSKNAESFFNQFKKNNSLLQQILLLLKKTFFMEKKQCISLSEAIMIF